MNDEYIFGSDIITDFDTDLTVGKASDFNLAKIDFKDLGYFLCKGFVRVSCENDHVFSGSEKRLPELFGEFEGDILSVMELLIEFSFKFLIDTLVFFIGHEVGLKLEKR